MLTPFYTYEKIVLLAERSPAIMKKLSIWQADLSLLSVAIIWGATFIVIKKALADISPFTFISLRFSAAFIFMLLILIIKQYKSQERIITTALLKAGSVIGLCVFLGFTLQTVGLKYTSATNAGFITGLCVILVPFINIFITKRLPPPSVIIGCLLAAAGLSMLTLKDGLTLHKGDIMMILCAFAFAFHIISVSYYSRKHYALHLATFQIGFIALLSTCITFLQPETSRQIVWSKDLWIALLLTSIPATSLAFLIQNTAQRFTTSTRTAIILSMEPVFGAFFAWLLGGEILTTKELSGAALVMLGILIAEFKDNKENLLFK